MRAIFVAAFAAIITSAASAEAAPVDRYKIASTVSPEAAAILKPIYEQVKAATAKPPERPVTLEDFEKFRAPGEKAAAENLAKQAASLGVAVTDDQINGVPVLRIRPIETKSAGRVLVYVHGGAYVMGSTKQNLLMAAKIATASRSEVISVEYTLAPRAKWQQTTEEVVRVWKGLLANKAKPGSIGFFGDSAGGGLVAGSVLRMRDEKLPLPGAIYLMSPWADITTNGDTIETLAADDPLVPVGDIEWVSALYAAPTDQKHPYVSPVYGDFSKPFPPTLIQASTREVLLSASVRLYQSIRGGGQDATLDVYEGLPHVFQGFVPDSPEGVTATQRAVAFFEQKLTSP